MKTHLLNSGFNIAGVLENLLQKYRHDGKRFWIKHSRGRWGQTLATSILQSLVCEHAVTVKEARQLRAALKTASKTIQDDAWWEQVRWRDFTKGCQLFVSGDKVWFQNPCKRVSKRSMTIFTFNEKLRRDFPNRRQIAEGWIGYVI